MVISWIVVDAFLLFRVSRDCRMIGPVHSHTPWSCLRRRGGKVLSATNSTLQVIRAL